MKYLFGLSFVLLSCIESWIKHIFSMRLLFLLLRRLTVSLLIKHINQMFLLTWYTLFVLIIFANLRHFYWLERGIYWNLSTSIIIFGSSSLLANIRVQPILHLFLFLLSRIHFGLLARLFIESLSDFVYFLNFSEKFFSWIERSLVFFGDLINQIKNFV